MKVKLTIIVACNFAKQMENWRYYLYSFNTKLKLLYFYLFALVTVIIANAVLVSLISVFKLKKAF